MQCGQKYTAIMQSLVSKLQLFDNEVELNCKKNSATHLYIT